MQKLTNEQAIALSVCTGTLCCDVELVRKEVECRLEKPVWLAQIADRKFMQSVKFLFDREFKEMMPESTQVLT